jgi:hypothetical protein
MHHWMYPLHVATIPRQHVSGLRAAATAARKPDTQPATTHYTDKLENQAPNTTDSNHLYNTLDLLMMGIMVPETC